uniref:HTH CENPB-type domain-containing protein n=1 Tax=Pelodiscus sinensis TaxID=13735 RepID=K7F3I0_PELSI
KGGDKDGEKRKRKTIVLEQKIAIVRQYEGGQTVSFMSHKLGLSKSTIGIIIKDSNHIREAVKGSASMKQRAVPFLEMEKILVLWMEDQIEKCTPLSPMTIQTKACSLFEDLKKEGYDYDQTFTASHGWFNHFKMHANLHNVKLSGEAASDDSKAAEPFLEELDKLTKEIFNVDETGLFWKKMPKCTYIRKQKLCLACKDCLTVLLGDNVSGYKLKPLLIYRSENPRAFKNISKATLPVHYSWMMLALFEDWFINCFILEVKSYFLEKGIPFQILLILDNAPGHPQKLNDLHSIMKVVFLAPNTTSILQTMDGALVAFKAYYLCNTFAKAVAATECKNNKTLRDFWKYYNILHCIRNIAAGWEEVTPQCMNVIWKKILKRFVNCFKGFEKVKALEDISNNIVQLAKKVDLEIDNEDIHQLVEDVGEELSNEDLMQLEAERYQRKAQEEEEEEAPKNFVIKEMAAVFSKINEGMLMFEKMGPNIARFSKVDRLIQDALACYKEIYNEKKKQIVQSKMDIFLKKVPSSAASHTEPMPSTSKR